MQRKGALLLFITMYVLCMVVKSSAQSNTSRQIVSEFEQQVSSSLEKVFIHTAKTIYLPGEIIWFKMYVTAALDNQPLPISKVGYVELIDPTSKSVLQAKILLDSGSGNGSFVIPSYLHTGTYTLRGYTNLMKNESSSVFFHQFIKIINPSKTTEPIVSEPVPSLQVIFFPEGGQLVSGLEHTVAFSFQDEYGYGVSGNGIVVNQKNDTILRFASAKFGLGRFELTPVPGDRYKALIKDQNGRQITAELPPTLSTGYSLQVKEVNATQLSVDIQTNSRAFTQEIYFIAHARNLIHIALALETREGRTRFLINKKELPEGISYFTLFNKDKEAVAERLYFIRPSHEMEISLTADHADYTTRSKINMNFSTTFPKAGSLSADLSAAVFLLDSFETENIKQIRNYLWLESELTGTIESPDYYFTSSEPGVSEATDNLMLTHGWRTLVPGKKEKKPLQFIPEFSGHIITGKVIDKRSGLPAKGIITYLSVPGDRFHFSSCRSDEKGQIKFDCKKIIGTENIIIQTNKEIDSMYRVEIDNPFVEQYPKQNAFPLIVPFTWQPQLLSRITNTQVQGAFTHTQTQQFYLPNFSDTTPFFGKPDKTYLLDDYTRFYTMEEVMREYVTEIQVRKNQKDFRYKMLNLPYKLFFESNPLVLLDGVPVFDINKIIAFDPLKVKRLDIVSRKYFQGSVAYDGIASYSTYNGDLAGYTLDPNAVILEYAGLQLQRQFYAPNYETKESQKSRIPDYRNLLYWSPDITTGENGKQQFSFYSGDLPGKYAIVVQGISRNGESGTGIVTVSVKK